MTKVDITGPSGKVELGPAHSMADNDIMAAIKGPLGNGKYTVNWQAAGKDGHVQKGAFSFSVQKAQQRGRAPMGRVPLDCDAGLLFAGAIAATTNLVVTSAAAASVGRHQSTPPRVTS